MPQLVRSYKSPRVGRRRRHKVSSEAEAEEGVGRFPGPEHHRGPDAERRDGRVVQPRCVFKHSFTQRALLLTESGLIHSLRHTLRSLFVRET